MTKTDFKRIRKLLKKTQKEMAELLSVSKKAIESYEQGLRNIPPNIQRIVYFLLFKLNTHKLGRKKNCWQVKRCTPEIRSNCVAWIAREGYFCWFITGKVCAVEKNNPESCCESCFDCSFFKDNLAKILTAEELQGAGIEI
jgi:transcriptional regulator with XRE-family HTH domain